MSNALDHVLRWLRSVQTETDRLARQPNRTAESLEDLHDLVSEWLRNPTALIELAAGKQPDLPRLLHAELLAQARLALAAEQGVRGLKLDWQADGSALALIDGQYKVPLSPKLGFLLQVLAADEGYSDDPFVPWKSPDHIRKELLRLTGTPISPQNLHTLTWRCGAPSASPASRPGWCSATRDAASALRCAGLCQPTAGRSPYLAVREGKAEALIE